MESKSWTIVKTTANGFSQDQVVTFAAALAYYAIFSIAPILVIIVGVVGIVFHGPAARQQVTQQLQGVLGQKSTDIIESMMSSQTRHGSVIATIIGVVVLLLGASGVFGQLKSSLNSIWHVRQKSGRGILGLILDRLLSVLMVFVIGVLLLASMLLTTAISAFYDALSRVIAVPGFVLRLGDLVATLAVLTLLFALIFKVLPDVRIRWRDVWIGAAVTAMLFLAGEYLLGLYLGRAGATSSYGAAGSVVAILMWIYYSSIILFLGAEFTLAYACRAGACIQPGKYAEPLEGAAAA